MPSDEYQYFLDMVITKKKHKARNYRLENAISIVKKIKISWKKAQKVDFIIFFGPFLGFTLKTVLGIHDPRISLLPFRTRNYKMRGPPVYSFNNTLQFRRLHIPSYIFYFYRLVSIRFNYHSNNRIQNCTFSTHTENE